MHRKLQKRGTENTKGAVKLSEMTKKEDKDNCPSDLENQGIFFLVPTKVNSKRENIRPGSAESRFRISKVPETELLKKDEKR